MTKMKEITKTTLSAVVEKLSKNTIFNYEVKDYIIIDFWIGFYD